MEDSVSLKKLIKLFKFFFILNNLENLVYWFLFCIDEVTISEYDFIETLFLKELSVKFGSKILIFEIKNKKFIKYIKIKLF
jgi:hypothetical protein